MVQQRLKSRQPGSRTLALNLKTVLKEGGVEVLGYMREGGGRAEGRGGGEHARGGRVCEDGTCGQAPGASGRGGGETLSHT